MKNLPRLLLIFASILALLGLFHLDAIAQTSPEPEIGIENPLPGQAVQGLVQIFGFIELGDEDFESYELSFSFSDQDAWFLIESSKSEISGNALGEWDTSSITDGTYDLKLSVNKGTGEELVLVVEGIRVRNYSAIETNTPMPTSEESTIVESPTPVATPTPEQEKKASPTPLSPNLANFAMSDLRNALIRGGIFGIILFAFLVLFFLRKKKL